MDGGAHEDRGIAQENSFVTHAYLRPVAREHIGQEVTLCGWVDSTRDHGGAVFVDLRDRYGKSQIVFAPEGGAGLVEQARRLRSEDVIRVTGKVALRPEGTVNPKLATGETELLQPNGRSEQIQDPAVYPRPDGLAG